MNTTKELATQESSQSLGGLSLVEYRNNRQLIKQIMQDEMRAGVDYGVTPGTSSKPALWKPGAEKINALFGFAPTFSHTERYHDGLHLTYTIKCGLTHRGSGTFLGDAEAVASTLETKWASKHGPDGTRIANNPADFYNTAIKMGGKRALIAAVLFTTAASDVFTQDIDDDEEGAKGGNGGAHGRQGGLPTRLGGNDTAKAAAGLWTGTMGAVTDKSFKATEGTQSADYILALEDGRSASTFDEAMAQKAREARGRIVKIGTKAGKKAGFFNVESFEAISVTNPAPKKEESRQQDFELERAPDDIPS